MEFKVREQNIKETCFQTSKKLLWEIEVTRRNRISQTTSKKKSRNLTVALHNVYDVYSFYVKLEPV